MKPRRERSASSRFAAKRKRRFRFRLLAVFLGIICLSCLYICQTVTVITLSARAKELKLEIERKRKIRKYLQIEVAELSSVQRIERLAKQMGLGYPSPGQTRLICESSDSTYLETPGLGKSLWSGLKTLQKNLLCGGDEAFAKEVKGEP